MTKNQIDYWRLQEEKRHNLDTEDMNRNLAVYTAYKNKREGDAAATKKWANAAQAVATIFSPLTSALGKSGN